MKVGKIKFKKDLYPLISITIYDYNANRDMDVKVTSEAFKTVLDAAYLNGTDEERKRLDEAYGDIQYFIPESLIGQEEDVLQAYLQGTTYTPKTRRK